MNEVLVQNGQDEGEATANQEQPVAVIVPE